MSTTTEVPVDQRRDPAPPPTRRGLRLRSGTVWSLPVAALLITGFFGPLVIVAIYAFMPPRTFQLSGSLQLTNFETILNQGFWNSYVWSLYLAVLTVLITLVLCYPLAYAMVKTFGPRWANVLVVALVLPLFVSENIRLLGWSLILGRGGVLGGTLQSLFNIEIGGLLFNAPATLLGLVYIYLPFMLFPLILGLSMVPDDLVAAARDLGAGRLQVFREVELPLAKPGLLIGVLLTFVLSLGSVAESLILGGKSVVMITTDIERAFSFQQNWPLGSALSLLLMVIAGMFVLLMLRRLDMDLVLSHGED
jgi:spermidine/putrescine transport system permease protein